MIFTPDSVDREEPVYLTDNLSTSYQRYVCVCVFVHDCYISNHLSCSSCSNVVRYLKNKNLS